MRPVGLIKAHTEVELLNAPRATRRPTSEEIDAENRHVSALRAAESPSNRLLFRTLHAEVTRPIVNKANLDGLLNVDSFTALWIGFTRQTTGLTPRGGRAFYWSLYSRGDSNRSATATVYYTAPPAVCSVLDALHAVHGDKLTSATFYLDGYYEASLTS